MTSSFPGNPCLGSSVQLTRAYLESVAQWFEAEARARLPDLRLRRGEPLPPPGESGAAVNPGAAATPLRPYFRLVDSTPFRRVFLSHGGTQVVKQAFLPVTHLGSRVGVGIPAASASETAASASAPITKGNERARDDDSCGRTLSYWFEVLNEAVILQSLAPHPNIVTFRELYIRPSDSSLFMVENTAPGVTLWALLCELRGPGVDEGGGIRQMASIWVIRDMILALAHLHYACDPAVVHWDLHPMNVMVSMNHAVLLDFGRAQTLGKTLPVFADEEPFACRVVEAFCPPAFPELPYLHRDHFLAHDCFCLGVLFYLILRGRFPQCELGDADTLPRMKGTETLDFPSWASAPVCDMVRGLLMPDRENRWTVLKCVRHVSNSNI